MTSSPNDLVASASPEKQEKNNSAIIEAPLPEVKGHQEECKVYPVRWLILIIFVCYSMSNAFQWIQFAIINGVVSKYYGVSSFLIDMTSLIYMITYIPLIFPASFFLHKQGLRRSVLIGSLGTCIGSWIKCCSASPDLFYVAFIGHTVVACSQTFILGIPPQLAAVWFGSNQVSTATSIGVFGNQLGVALGFLIPPMLVKNGTIEEIGGRLSTMYYGAGTVTSILLVLIIIFFKDRPPTPPSFSQAALIETPPDSYLGSIKNLLTNKGYILLLVSYGMNVGVFYAISTLLSEFILKYFPDNAEDTGRIGLMIVVSGMAGSVLSGIILDKTKRYKETTLVIYVLSLAGMLVYTFTLKFAGSIILLYIVFSALGFFMTGYLPVGFEFAAEITYPESEGTSSGLLNASAQAFGILMTPITRLLFESELGDVGANLALALVLAGGVVMTALIKPDLRRQAAARASTYKEKSYDNAEAQQP